MVVARALKRETYSDRLFVVANTGFLLFLLAIVIYPLVYVVSASISDPIAVNSGEMWLWPHNITFEGYERVFQNSEIWMGYRNTVIITVMGVAIHLAILLPCAYALSRSDLAGRTFIMMMFLFTMFFSGGLIPTFLVVKQLGMVNTLWALVVPNAVGVWGIIVARTFFQMNVPKELQEASQMDGCSDFGLFFRIVLPLSAPIIAVLALFNAVGHWNQYFNALIYLNNRDIFPLQLILREILVQQQMSAQMMMQGDDLELLAQQARIADIIKYAVMIVSSLPLLVAYPFVQKYFVKGVLIGSIKG
jgi:putative aldouronate transport system permease protein